MARVIKNISNRIATAYNSITSLNRKGDSGNKHMAAIQLARLKVDVQKWREAIAEAERAYFPFRYKMQQIYVDTVLNGQTKACWERRKDLTLLRSFKILNENGKPDEELVKLFTQTWFKTFISFALDAQAYGYSLIFIGDLINSQFKGTEIIKRWNISPDRQEIQAFPYAPSGVKFLEDSDLSAWHIYVPTTNETGASNCGYGLLYEVAVYEIYLRSALAFNVDYAQNYGQPIRVGKTSKTDEAERNEFFQSMVNMGNNATILMDTNDEVELVESKGAGSGYKVYESLELRCEKKISKLILGPADAMDSVPGKLGASHGADSPVDKALMDKQTKDAGFLTPIINDELIPRMRALGFNIPEGYTFEFENDDEKESFRKKEDISNAVTAGIFKTIKDAGGVPDWDYFTERTGIPTTAAAVEPTEKKEPFNEKITNKLKALYQ